MRSHSEQLCQISDVYDGLRLRSFDDVGDVYDGLRLRTSGDGMMWAMSTTGCAYALLVMG